MAKFKISDVVDVYFNLKGRIGRGEFWAYGVPLSLVFYLAVAVSTLAPSPWGELACLVVYAVFLWAYMGLLVKRGHDRDRPAVLSILVLAARVVLALTGAFVGGSPLIIGLQAALILYVLVDYALLPGKLGPNRYGPSPSGLGNKTPLVLGGDEASDGAALPASSPKA
jgi:uncharacterized membrane protein YhaH (DUF805 family)